MQRAKGQFDVKGTARPPNEVADGLGASRMTFQKQFHGALAATSVVEMLGIMNKEIGSGGYVALERVSGTLAGRAGSFCLQHSSTMTRGSQKQSITVVPDSGTDALAGLQGSMVIDIVDGKHFYTFDYA